MADRPTRPTCWSRRLAGWSFEERVANPCIGADRADLVLAGCAILEAIRRVWPAQRLRVADRGLREGMLTEMMAADGVWRRTRLAKTEATAMSEPRRRRRPRPDGPGQEEARLKASSRRWLERQLNDPYVQRAKAEGYRSRAAYKLIEIDESTRS